ncbi:MAG: phosphate ABC transporter substrate-binding protein [Candidatus Methanofastidiosia archaeon]
MENRNMAVLAVLIVGVILIGAYTAGWFSGEKAEPPELTETPEPGEPTETPEPGETGEIQTLTIQGSTTVLPIVQKAAEKYMDQHPHVDIRISGGGSSVGVKSAGEQTTDIGMASREIKDEEKSSYPDLRLITIAKDGIALIVHPSNSIEKLTIEHIKGIYNGTYTNWSQVGGDDAEIVVVGRDSASGTREFFWKNVMDKEDFVRIMLEKNSNGAVKQTIIQTPGAIGYVGLGYLDDSVKAVNIHVDGKDIEPTIENIQNGSYPISRNLYLLIIGEPTGLAKDFIDFILGEEGQAIVAEEGFVPI